MDFEDKFAQRVLETTHDLSVLPRSFLVEVNQPPGSSSSLKAPVVTGLNPLPFAVKCVSRQRGHLPTPCLDPTIYSASPRTPSFQWSC